MNSTTEEGSLRHEDRLRLAMSLGLTLYEAQSYLALLERGEAKAAQIATVSRVPRGRVYEVLASLHAKGLVAVVSATPLRYKPVALKTFIERRREELRAVEEDLERNATRLMAQITPRPTPNATGEFLLFRMRQPVVRKFREMIESAQKEVLVSASEMCVVRGSRLFLDACQARAEAGVAIRVSTRVTDQNRAAVAAYVRAVGMRHTELGNRGTSILVVDGREVFIVHWNPDDDDPYHGEDAGLWSTDPGVVESFHSIVQETWDRGLEASVRLRELETGEEPETTRIMPQVEAIANLIPCITIGARKEIAVSSSASVLEVAHAPEYQPLVEALGSRKVRKRMLVVRDRATLDTLRLFANHGFEVRIAQSPTIEHYVLIDRKEVFTRVWRAPPVVGGAKPQLPTPEDLFVRTNAKSVVDALADAFEMEWERAMPLDIAADAVLPR